MQTWSSRNRKSRAIGCGVCALVSVLLTGCIFFPCPHTTVRTGAVRGRVTDARTRAPIPGATVFFPEHPNVSCATDGSGRFRLGATHNFHLGYFYSGERADWPPPRFAGCLLVSHPGYETNGLEVGEAGFAGEILLRPRE